MATREVFGMDDEDEDHTSPQAPATSPVEMNGHAAPVPKPAPTPAPAQPQPPTQLDFFINSDRHYFAFRPLVELRAVAGLSATTRGVYWSLRCYCLMHPGGLQVPQNALTRAMCGADAQQFRRAVKDLLAAGLLTVMPDGSCFTIASRGDHEAITREIHSKSLGGRARHSKRLKEQQTGSAAAQAAASTDAQAAAQETKTHISLNGLNDFSFSSENPDKPSPKTKAGQILIDLKASLTERLPSGSRALLPKSQWRWDRMIDGAAPGERGCKYPPEIVQQALERLGIKWGTGTE